MSVFGRSADVAAIFDNAFRLPSNRARIGLNGQEP